MQLPDDATLLYASDPTGEEKHRFLVMQYRPIRVASSLRGDDEIFHLQTPWLISLVRMSTLSMYLFARRAEITPEEDMCYILGWPHIADTGSVCYHPTGHLQEYDLSGGTPLERDMARALACMQIFFNGNSSYFICRAESVVPEMREAIAVAREANTTPSAGEVTWAHNTLAGSAEYFFRSWEKLNLEQVLTLSYVPDAPLSQIIAQITKMVDAEIQNEKFYYQHGENVQGFLYD